MAFSFTLGVWTMKSAVLLILSFFDWQMVRAELNCEVLAQCLKYR